MRFFITILAIFWPLMAVSQNYPDFQDIYINDFANIIDEATEARMRTELTDLRKETGREMVVVTVPGIAQYGATGSVEAFTVGLFNHWGVGNAETNDGVLMLVALADREQFTAVGDGFGRRYDDGLDLIFDQVMRERFRAEEYSLGIEAGMDATLRLLSGPPPEPPTTWERFGTWLNDWFMFILVGMIMAFFVAKDWIMDQSYRLRRCPTCGHRGLRRRRNVLTAATRSAAGEREIDVTCPNCDYHDHSVMVIPRRTGSSSSSGGFGGGSSSGGGGGRW